MMNQFCWSGFLKIIFGGQYEVLNESDLCAWVSCAVIAIAADGPVGSVKTMKGAASIIRLNVTVTANIGERVFKGDVLRTGRDGSLGVAFKDDSLLSLGPNSEIVIDEFPFRPARASCQSLPVCLEELRHISLEW